MTNPDQFHLARKTPATTVTDFESNLDMDALCHYRLGWVHDQLLDQDLAGCLLYDPTNNRYATGTRNYRTFRYVISGRPMTLPSGIIDAPNMTHPMIMALTSSDEPGG